MRTFADGQVSKAPVAIFICGQDHNFPSAGNITGSLSLVNVSKTKQTILVALRRQQWSGAVPASVAAPGAPRRIGSMELEPNQSGVVRGITLQMGDSLEAEATDAESVDYVLSDCDGSVAFEVVVFEPFGKPKAPVAQTPEVHATPPAHTPAHAPAHTPAHKADADADDDADDDEKAPHKRRR